MSLTMDYKKVLTIKDVEEMYAIDMKQQEYHRSRGGMPYQKIGTNILYNRRKLESYLLDEVFEVNWEKK